MQLFNNFYRNKRVLVTGHAGFKGSWLSLWLSQLNAKVAGYSLLPNSQFRLYEILNLDQILEYNIIADLCEYEKLEDLFNKFQPEIVFHLAAQSLVRPSYSNPVETYSSNVMGTLYVLEAARKSGSVKQFINVTTDKCYENKEQNQFFNEEDPLGGYDIYSSSKACSEILTSSYRNSFLKNGGFALASARAGNVVGGGDWSIDRLVTDCITAFSNDEELIIRSPVAIRPWQFVLECLAGYLLLGQKLAENPEQYSKAYNFGPNKESILKVIEVAELLATYWNMPNSELFTSLTEVAKNPDGLTAPRAKIVLKPDDKLHEATILQLDISKAKQELGFNPVWNVNKAIFNTAKWYKAFFSKEYPMIELSKLQLQEFISDAKSLNLIWTK